MSVPTCTEIEHCLAQEWGPRQNIIVPNVSWGLGIHECDLLIASKSGWATEIEIKVSRADLKKDAGKGHGHISNKIKWLYFALPEALENCLDLVPAHAGVIIIRNNFREGYSIPRHSAEFVRSPTPNQAARKLDDDEMKQLMRLGCLRIWTLKQSVIRLKAEIKFLKHEKQKINT